MTPEQRNLIKEALERLDAAEARIDAMVATLEEREARGIETPEEVERLLLECSEQATEVVTKMVRLVRKRVASRRSPTPHYPEVEIDTRAQIRESRAYEATTGPPRPGTNESGPAGSSPQAGPPTHVRFAPEPRTANLTRIADSANVDFFDGGEVRPKTGRKSGAAGLETNEVRHENSKKPH